jgi:DNA-directed RNA polymerase subunit RPC12/RpoP
VWRIRHHSTIQVVVQSEMNLGNLVAGLGNTVGSLISYKCPRCGETRRISEYDGNIIDGSAECPSCNKDPSPWATRDECKLLSNLIQKYLCTITIINDMY